MRDLIEFIQDDDRLREERKKAKKNKDKYIGVSSDAMGGMGMRSNFDDYRNREGFGASRNQDEKGCEYEWNVWFDFVCDGLSKLERKFELIKAYVQFW